MAPQPVPEGYHTLTPSLSINGAAAAIEFYTRAFGATERGRMDGPGGSIAHAEIVIGDSIVMLADPFPMSSTKPPAEIGGTSSSIFIYTEDVDSLYRRAIDAGAISVMEPEDMFWGDRFATITDPFGHVWNLATRVEDVSEDEMRERAQKWQAEMAATSSR
ncbi:MAG TPA: VOC family protein [Gaiellaceae bacterium]|jgi:PhnB protein|nr:VOC family protein [Gaiellaceae bacterium]HEX2496892.1 VOC family protein [Gaiellaceae bacterium]